MGSISWQSLIIARDLSQRSFCLLLLLDSFAIKVAQSRKFAQLGRTQQQRQRDGQSNFEAVGIRTLLQ